VRKRKWDTEVFPLIPETEMKKFRKINKNQCHSYDLVPDFSLLHDEEARDMN
jgi:hypothetical protein